MKEYIIHNTSIRYTYIFTFLPSEDFKKCLPRTSFQNSFRPSICKDTRFNAFFLPLSPPRAHTPYSTSCSATPILIFHYDGSCSVGSEGRAAYAQWKVGRGKRSPPAGVVISSVIFAHGTGRSSPRFRRFPTGQISRLSATRGDREGDGFVSSRLLLTDFLLNG